MIIISGKTHQASIWQICKLCGQEYRQTIYIQNIDEELQDPAHKYTAPEGEIIRRDISKRLIRSYQTDSMENRMNKEQFYNPGEEIIETNRLIMRRLRPEDYLAMAAWDMDERVYKYLMSSVCKTPEEPLAWLPKKDPTSKINILMLVIDKEDGHAVGTYALNHDVERDVWTVSYVNRYDDWGKGYSTEGMKAFIDHAVKVYGAHSFEGECAKENVGSAKVLQKLGMVYDHSSSYSKNDGSATFESDVYVLKFCGVL